MYIRSIYVLYVHFVFVYMCIHFVYVWIVQILIWYGAAVFVPIDPWVSSDWGSFGCEVLHMVHNLFMGIFNKKACTTVQAQDVRSTCLFFLLRTIASPTYSRQADRQAEKKRYWCISHTQHLQNELLAHARLRLNSRS